MKRLALLALTLTLVVAVAGDIALRPQIMQSAEASTIINPYRYADPDLFITTWETTGDDEEIQLPIGDTGSPNFWVDWGDGSALSHVTTWDDPDTAHTYEDAGTYTVEIDGNVPQWVFGDAPEPPTRCSQFRSVEQWGAMVFTLFKYAFFECTVAYINATDAPNVSAVGNFRNAFNQAYNADIDFTGWDTSSATNFSAMFRDVSGQSHSLGGLDVEKLSTASNMFRDGGMTTEAYDATLIGWEAQDVNDGVPFHAGSSCYSSGAAATAHAALIADHSWTITDGGQCP